MFIQVDLIEFCRGSLGRPPCSNTVMCKQSGRDGVLRRSCRLGQGRARRARDSGGRHRHYYRPAERAARARTRTPDLCLPASPLHAITTPCALLWRRGVTHIKLPSRLPGTSALRPTPTPTRSLIVW